MLRSMQLHEALNHFSRKVQQKCFIQYQYFKSSVLSCVRCNTILKQMQPILQIAVHPLLPSQTLLDYICVSAMVLVLVQELQTRCKAHYLYCIPAILTLAVENATSYKIFFVLKVTSVYKNFQLVVIDFFLGIGSPI